MEDGLVHYVGRVVIRATHCLNPYCSGRWSRTYWYSVSKVVLMMSLNPYCSGRWSRTELEKVLTELNKARS